MMNEGFKIFEVDQKYYVLTNTKLKGWLNDKIQRRSKRINKK